MGKETSTATNKHTPSRARATIPSLLVRCFREARDFGMIGFLMQSRR